MASTCVVISGHGAPNSPGPATFAATETPVDGQLIYYKLADDDGLAGGGAQANPIPIPASGTGYSWRKSTRLKCTGAPAGVIKNLRAYSDGVDTSGSGFTTVGHSLPIANYTQATSADASSQIAQNGGSSVVDTKNQTVGSPLVINSGTVLTATTGYGTQDIYETQMTVSSTAAVGYSTTRGFFYAWDET